MTFKGPFQPKPLYAPDPDPWYDFLIWPQTCRITMDLLSDNSTVPDPNYHRWARSWSADSCLNLILDLPYQHKPAWRSRPLLATGCLTRHHRTGSWLVGHPPCQLGYHARLPGPHPSPRAGCPTARAPAPDGHPQTARYWNGTKARNRDGFPIVKPKRSRNLNALFLKRAVSSEQAQPAPHQLSQRNTEAASWTLQCKPAGFTWAASGKAAPPTRAAASAVVSLLRFVLVPCFTFSLQSFSLCIRWGRG